MSPLGILTVRASPDCSVSNQSNKRKVRIFDDVSTLDPTLKPILTNDHITSPHKTAGRNVTAPPSFPTEVNGGRGEIVTGMAEKRIKALEEELARLKLAMEDVEQNLQSERGRKAAAEQRVKELQGDLQK